MAEETVSRSRSGFLLAVLTATAVMLVVGGILYGYLFAGLFAEGALRLPGVMRERPQLAWILAGQIGFSFLLVLILSWRGATTLWAGAATGALFGGLMAIGYDFSQYATSHLWTLQATLLDPLLSALLVGSGGAAAGWVLGRAETTRAGS